MQQAPRLTQEEKKGKKDPDPYAPKYCVGHQLMLDINESNQYAKIFYTCSLDFSEMVGSIVQPHVFQDAVNLSMFAALM